MTGTQATAETTDLYAESAEFFDLMAHAHWERSGPVLAGLLATVDATAGPVVDIGAGTGLSTRIIADALPSARILAIEPSAPMRVGLTGRVFADPRLRERVTVVPASAQTAELPERISAAVVFGVLGYLDAEERRRLWHALAARLPPGGPVAVELMAMATPQTLPRRLVTRVRMGEWDHEVWMRGEPAGPARMRFTSTFRTLHGSRVLRQFEVPHEWSTLGVDALSAEAGAAGFHTRHVADAIHVLNRQR